ncbi:MAG TPA: hypothetical protein HPP97_11045 [Desulfuromonadales bacterium]|nr:hypothetical protein [Desulfuromonadales bacterium]
MIEHEKQYVTFIQAKGVGKNDKIEGASPRSYLGYLTSVSEILDFNISPQTVKTDDDVNNILSKLKNHNTIKRADKTIRNYGSALKKYAEMVQELRL